MWVSEGRCFLPNHKLSLDLNDRIHPDVKSPGKHSPTTCFHAHEVVIFLYTEKVILSRFGEK